MNECPLAVTIEPPANVVGICKVFIACKLTGKQCVCCRYSSFDNTMVMNPNVEICPGYHNPADDRIVIIAMSEEEVRERVLEGLLPVEERRTIAIPAVLPQIDAPLIAAERLPKKEDTRPWQERKRSKK